ncbi:hypothetical protein ACQJBY_031523 [Aegilops geniculata]
MGILDHSEDEEEEVSGGGARFGARRQKPRSKSHHQLLLMDSVGKAGTDGECASEEEEVVPLPEYERLSQSARLPDDDDDPVGAEDPPPPAERSASLTPPPRQQQQQKPAAWRLLQYVRSMHRSSAGAVVAGGYCGGSSDGDSKSSDGDKEGVDGDKEGGDGDGDDEGRKDKQQRKKKRSSWLPDPDRRWPVQGFY